MIIFKPEEEEDSDYGSWAQKGMELDPSVSDEDSEEGISGAGVQNEPWSKLVSADDVIMQQIAGDGTKELMAKHTTLPTALDVSDSHQPSCQCLADFVKVFGKVDSRQIIRVDLIPFKVGANDNSSEVGTR